MLPEYKVSAIGDVPVRLEVLFDLRIEASFSSSVPGILPGIIYCFALTHDLSLHFAERGYVDDIGGGNIGCAVDRHYHPVWGRRNRYQVGYSFLL